MIFGAETFGGRQPVSPRPTSRGPLIGLDEEFTESPEDFPFAFRGFSRWIAACAAMTAIIVIVRHDGRRRA